MKTCKRLLALLAVFSLTLAMMPVLQTNAEEEMFDLSWADPENEEMTVLEADELTDLEKEALMQIPAVKASKALGEYFLNTGYAADEIPECYGGAYINDEYQLVIKITAGYQAICDDIRSIMPSDASFAFEESDISLADLISIQGETLSLYKNMISSSGISQKDSVVNVKVPPEYAELISSKIFSTFNNNLSPYVRFHITEGRPELTTSLIGGNALYAYDDASKWTAWGTIGFCGTYKALGQSFTGVITAGHMADRALFYGINNPVGNLSEQLNPSGTIPNSIVQFKNGEKGDYALIPAGKNTLTNLVRLGQNTTGKITTSYNTTPISDDFQGRQVLKYGIKTGLTAGTIQEINTSNSYGIAPNLTEIFGLTSFMNNTLTVVDSGDSGGPVWYIEDNGTRQLRGVISGTYNPDKRLGYFSRLEYPCQNNSYLPKLN